MTRDVVSMHRVFIWTLRCIFPWLRNFLFSRVIETLRALLEKSKRKTEKLFPSYKLNFVVIVKIIFLVLKNSHKIFQHINHKFLTFIKKVSILQKFNIFIFNYKHHVINTMAKKNIINEEFGEVDELSEVLKSISKQYGEGTVMCLGDKPKMDIEVIPSGSFGLDIALGVGGYPRGRIVEIYGPESSGKTTLAIHAVAEAQKMGLRALYVDAENAFDKEYSKALGVDVDKLLFTQPDCAEDCLEIAAKIIKSGKVGICVIDSVAALVPRQELEGEMGDAKIGLLARLMSQSLRKLIGIAKESNCLVIFINQIREKIGVLFGNPETTTGGNALKFYASQRIEVRKSTAVKDGDEAIANLTKVKVVKNKVAPPFKKCEFEILFGKGINKQAEIIDLAIESDIVHKSGSWFSYEGDKLCQGRNALISLLEDNPELMEEIEAKLKSWISNNQEETLEDILEQ